MKYYHIWFEGRNGRTVQWCLCCIRFQDHQSFGIVYLISPSARLRCSSAGKHTRADLSLLLVMQYVLSLLICRSVTTSPCARSLLSTSSPVLMLNSATFPDSCPVMMTLGVKVNAHTVAFDPMGLNICKGSCDSAFQVKRCEENVD